MEQVVAYHDFEVRSASFKRCFLLLYKGGSEISECAFINLGNLTYQESDSFRIFAADINQVQDIHKRFNITTVPSVLVFENGEYTNAIKGCHDTAYYLALIQNIVFQDHASSGSVAPSVKVYTTPTCSWCNTLKVFLRKNGISFNEIDISRDEQSAGEMVSKSGQQGVPQTEINGQMVVGFNQQKLKELLEIQ